MTKSKLIEKILYESKIHHNIYVNWSKLPDYTEEDHFDPLDIAGYMLDDFMELWQEEPINDSGNRNLCGCNWSKSDKYKPANILKSGACKVHDLWNVYTHDRMGATLYWDKYWKSTNSGFYFKYDWDDELKEMPLAELKTIYKEITAFNEAVADLMTSFYAGCKYKLEESRKEKAEEEKEKKLFTNFKETILKNDFQKRMCKELLNL